MSSFMKNFYILVLQLFNSSGILIILFGITHTNTLLENYVKHKNNYKIPFSVMTL